VSGEHARDMLNRLLSAFGVHAVMLPLLGRQRFEQREIRLAETAKLFAATRTDASGNFWLFGGNGYDSTATGFLLLHDLWEYSAGEWTWVSGAKVAGQPATYGTQGTPALKNVPGARYPAVSWIDTSGDFWLFGGQGFDPTGNFGSFNELWEYEP
jgi:hypothetical protein